MTINNKSGGVVYWFVIYFIWSWINRVYISEGTFG